MLVKAKRITGGFYDESGSWYFITATNTWTSVPEPFVSAMCKYLSNWSNNFECWNHADLDQYNGQIFSGRRIGDNITSNLTKRFRLLDWVLISEISTPHVETPTDGVWKYAPDKKAIIHRRDIPKTNLPWIFLGLVNKRLAVDFKLRWISTKDSFLKGYDLKEV